MRNAQEASIAVREEIEAGAKVVKLMASGGLHDAADEPQKLAMDPDAIAAAIRAARSEGIPVAAHAHHPDVIIPLVEAGVDSIEHGALVDRAAAQAMARSGTVLVSTLSIFDAVASMSGLDAATRVHYESISRRAQEACRIAEGEGVTIVAGTDSGGPETPHGSIAREIRLLAAAGIARETVLAAATARAAELLRIHDGSGRIAVGSRADIVAVGGDPSTDIAALSSVDWVMSGGRLIAEYRR